MGDLLLVGSCNGMIRGLDKSSGQVKWAYDIRKDGEQSQFHGDPLITDELIVIGTDGKIGHVYAFERATGAVRWKYKVEGRGVASDILRLGQNIYAVTLADELICLDLATGKLKWSFHSSFASEDFHWTSSPAVADRIYFGGLDGIVYALDAQSGKQIWKKDVGGRISTSVVLHRHDLYVGTSKRHVYRLDSASGEVLGDFQTAAEPRGHLVVTPNSVVVFLGDEIVASLDLDLKKTRWSVEASKEWTSARPYLWHGMLLAGNRRELVAFSSTDGARVWSYQFPEVVRGIGTSEDVLFVGTLNGPVFACARQP